MLVICLHTRFVDYLSNYLSKVHFVDYIFLNLGSYSKAISFWFNLSIWKIRSVFSARLNRIFTRVRVLAVDLVIRCLNGNGHFLLLVLLVLSFCQRLVLRIFYFRFGFLFGHNPDKVLWHWIFGVFIIFVSLKALFKSLDIFFLISLKYGSFRSLNIILDIVLEIFSIFFTGCALVRKPKLDYLIWLIG